MAGGWQADIDPRRKVFTFYKGQGCIVLVYVGLVTEGFMVDVLCRRQHRFHPFFKWTENYKKRRKL